MQKGLVWTWWKALGGPPRAKARRQGEGSEIHHTRPRSWQLRRQAVKVGSSGGEQVIAPRYVPAHPGGVSSGAEPWMNRQGTPSRSP